ncbi:ABC transporter permease [Pedobacter sp. R-06]|uniref:ABC transporter permease n=1 Tax=Pedobacter sp. R-06 TaxID=3404051 RepID=UPI003CF40AEE
MKKSIYTLEFKLFFRNSSSGIGIIVLLITGFAGLYFGKTFIANQQAVIEKAAMLQKKNTLSNIDHFGKDIGLLFYHNKFSLANAPNAWAAFANGQRDINPYLISVTMLGLEGQLYDTDINNPVSLLLGNMDLSFVFIFLFPLVIIAFSYNLLSEQKESGVWSLLSAQTSQSFQVIWQKFLVRVAVIFTVALLLLFVAILYLHLPVDFIFFSITALIMLYLAFWFAVSFFIISLAKSSNFNASALVAIWVLICIVIPASLNLFLTRKYPMPEALQHVINQREGYHEKWDMAKEVTMKPFFEHYPQLKQYPFPQEKTFSWFWYYAMQQMGDDQAMASRRAIENKLAARQRFTNAFAFFFPTIQTQLGINNMAGSDLNTHLDFQQAVRKYHEQIRLHFYPGIFLNKAVDSTDIKDYKLEKYSPQQIPSVWVNLLSILLFTVILIGTTAFNFKRQKQF